MGRGMVSRPTTSHFRVVSRGASIVVPTWCGWGMLWLVVAQLFVSAFSAAEQLFWRSNPPLLSLFPPPAGGAGRPVEPGATGIVLSWYFYPSAHGSGRSAHAVDGMVLCHLLVLTAAVSLVSSSFSRELCRLVVVVVGFGHLENAP